MKTKKILPTVLILLAIVSAVVFSVSASTQESYVKDKMDSHFEKIQARRNVVLDDIKNSHKINEKVYPTQLFADDIPAYTKTNPEFNGILNELISAAPNGSFSPFIFINQNKDEMLFAYKDEGGNNVVQKCKKIDGKWIKQSDESKKGILIPEINDN